jgi:hypothetical protein
MHAETLFKPLFKGGLDVSFGGTNPFANRTDIGSGVVTVTVSTTGVGSDSLIFTSVEMTSGGIINSTGPIVVNSKVAGVSFALTTPNGVAAPFTRTVVWMIVNPKG